MFGVRSNARAFERSLNDTARRQLPFALAKGLTATAKRVQKAEPARLERVLDRPTPFTKRGAAVRPARKRQLTASVFYKDRQADYLETLEEGGERRPRGRALLVPVNVKLNRYGNLTRNKVQRLLARPDVFSGRVGRAAGIFQQTKRGPRLLIAYEPSARYRPQLGFRRAAAARARRAFPVELRRSMRQALKTAR